MEWDFESWRPDLELSVWAYHAHELDVGRRACDRLLATAKLPHVVTEAAARNATFYARVLRDEPGVGVSPLTLERPDGWSAFNPSIGVNESGELHVAIRSSNYVRAADGTYLITDHSNLIRSRTALATVDGAHDVRGVRWIDDSAVAATPPRFSVTGLEDGRLSRADGSWWLSGTVRDYDESGVCRIALDRLDDDAVVTSRTYFDGPEPTRHEKNWMPIVDGADGLRFLYSLSPEVITSSASTRHRDLATWQGFATDVSRPGLPLARRLRGGTQVVRYHDGWLALVHESIDFDAHNRNYLHRWVALDALWRLTSISHPFTFFGQEIEFAAGLVLTDDRVLVSFGVRDAEAWLADVPRSVVERQLNEPVERR